LEEVAALVSAHPGVSHNYARPHHYNLWFTLAVPPGRDLAAAIDRLATRAGVHDWLNLPALRVFKLRTHFTLRQRQAGPGSPAGGAQGYPSLAGGRASDVPSQGEGLDPADIPFVRALQADLPLVLHPFAPAAGRLGVSEEELLDKAHDLASSGILRRFGAVLRHRRVGYRANGMACWAVPEPQIEEAGRYAAGLPQVSHCYQRPAVPPRWPYTLFTMIHGRSEDEVEVVAAEIAKQTGTEQYEILYSTHEFKKERVRYFEEEA
jgi:DNA-binding Lrp family transcriptional regulator